MAALKCRTGGSRATNRHFGAAIARVLHLLLDLLALIAEM